MHPMPNLQIYMSHCPSSIISCYNKYLSRLLSKANTFIYALDPTPSAYYFYLQYLLLLSASYLFKKPHKLAWP